MSQPCQPAAELSFCCGGIKHHIFLRCCLTCLLVLSGVIFKTSFDTSWMGILWQNQLAVETSCRFLSTKKPCSVASSLSRKTVPALVCGLTISVLVHTHFATFPLARLLHSHVVLNRLVTGPVAAHGVRLTSGWSEVRDPECPDPGERTLTGLVVDTWHQGGRSVAVAFACFPEAIFITLRLLLRISEAIIIYPATHAQHFCEQGQQNNNKGFGTTGTNNKGYVNVRWL